MAYITEWEAKGIFWKYRGTLTGSELLQSNREIYGDKRFDNMRYQIVDLTGVNAIHVSAKDMLTLAACDEAAAISNPNVRIAVVATKAEAKALSYFYDDESTASPWETKLFASVRDARAWLKA